jgi:hypothetical protein
MSRLPAPRRADWIPGAVALAVGGAIAAGIGWALGARGWALYVGLAAGVILMMGWLERVLSRRPTPSSPPRRPRGRLRVIEGGKGNGHAEDYDLETDSSTDGQRYLM